VFEFPTALSMRSSVSLDILIRSSCPVKVNSTRIRQIISQKAEPFTPLDISLRCELLFSLLHYTTLIMSMNVSNARCRCRVQIISRYI
jgi:hypothetical protein